MTPAILQELFDTTAAEEGFRPYLYDDANGEPIVPGYTLVGHPTLWFGLCVEKGRIPRIPMRIPRQVLELVAQDKADSMLRALPWMATLPDRTQLGLAAMAYQLGVDGVLGFRNMIAALRAGQLTEAKRHALDSQWAKKDTPARARRVAAMIANEPDEED